MSKVIIKANTKYQELGFVIMPKIREHGNVPVEYPVENIIQLPIGSRISGAKSQNDWAKFGVPDDVIRIYALVPEGLVSKENLENHLIYVFPTGKTIEIPQDAEKLTICKISKGEFIFHIYNGGIVS